MAGNLECMIEDKYIASITIVAADGQSWHTELTGLKYGGLNTQAGVPTQFK